MASNNPNYCCTVGVKHEGEAKGRLETWDGTGVYISTPDDGNKDSAIIIFPDVIGHKFINVQLIADQFAQNGYYCCVVDTFHGDPVPLNRPPTFDMAQWRNGTAEKGGHLPPRVDPVCAAVIKKLRGDIGIKGKIGAVGYCFGAKYVVRFLGTTGVDAGQTVDVGYVAHPTSVEPDELRAINGPLSIAASEIDHAFPPDKRHLSEEILLNKSTSEEKLPYQITLYSGVTHGFAVRADLADDRAKFAKEQAFIQCVLWMNKYLRGN